MASNRRRPSQDGDQRGFTGANRSTRSRGTARHASQRPYRSAREQYNAAEHAPGSEHAQARNYSHRKHEVRQSSAGAHRQHRDAAYLQRQSRQLPATGGSEYSRSASRYTSSKRGMGMGKKIAIGVVAVLVVALVGTGTALALWYKSIDDKLHASDDGQQISNLAETTSGEPYYVLLLGGDSRHQSKKDNRSDSMMVARIDEANQKVSLISVPRDLRVNMGTHGYQKINAAIEFGGYDYAIEIVNAVLGIKISHYAFIYFDGFEQLVDKLGGVTVKVPEGTYYNGTWVPAGEKSKINGKQALVLARCRHGNPPDSGAYAMGDYQRTMNQRNLIKAIAKKVLASDVTAMPDLISSLADCVQTSFTGTELIRIAQVMKGMDVDDMNAEQLPIAGARVNGAWTAVLYEDVFKVMKKNFVNGDDLLKGLGNFNEENNDNDIGSDYTDGEVYSYTTYADKYGDFKSSSKSSSKASSSSSG